MIYNVFSLYKNIQKRVLYNNIEIYFLILSIKDVIMKQSPTQKDNYLKFSFLYPVLFSLINGTFVVLSFYLASKGLTHVPNTLPYVIATIAMVFMALSPPTLIATVFISMRHRNKNPNGSGFYRQAPLALSFLVMGFEVLYMVMLTMV